MLNYVAQGEATNDVVRRVPRERDFAFGAKFKVQLPCSARLHHPFPVCLLCAARTVL
jgi:hypothetical protein